MRSDGRELREQRDHEEKSKVSDLALFGGVKMFAEPQHVGRPNIGDRKRLISRIEDMLDRCWLTNNGKYVQEFEREVAVLLGAKHCIATCNGTVALEIAIRAAGLSGEVIVPSFTFVATAHALQWQAIVPVFSDIDPETHTIDPAPAMRLITPRTAGIFGVTFWAAHAISMGSRRLRRNGTWRSYLTRRTPSAVPTRAK